MLLFSGGKDSIVLLRLAEKAFAPAALPFAVMHVDTGHNFPEVIEFRDRARREPATADRRLACRSRSTTGRVVEETGPRASRNRLQTTTLLDAIAEHGFDAAFGGARRDEERARAKERVFSFRDDFGQWDPRRQRPELWDLYNGRVRRGEHVRVFPLSNWTELDVWEYIPPRSSSSRRSTSPTSARCSSATGCSTRSRDFVERIDGEEPFVESVRYRTVGDMTLHRRRALARDDARGRRGRDRRDADDRARRDARRRPCVVRRHGRPQAGGVLLDAPRDRRTRPVVAPTDCCASPPPAPSTTASRR